MTDRSHSRSWGHEQGRSQWNSTLGTSLITLTHHNICSPTVHSINPASQDTLFSLVLWVQMSVCLSANFLNDFLCFLMTFLMGSLRLVSFWRLFEFILISQPIRASQLSQDQRMTLYFKIQSSYTYSVIWPKSQFSISFRNSRIWVSLMLMRNN